MKQSAYLGGDIVVRVISDSGADEKRERPGVAAAPPDCDLRASAEGRGRACVGV